MTSIPQALEQLDDDADVGKGAGMSRGAKIGLFNATKQTGKLVMFEGDADSPSLLINFRQEEHISVALSRAEIVALTHHFINILAEGDVA